MDRTAWHGTIRKREPASRFVLRTKWQEGVGVVRFRRAFAREKLQKHRLLVRSSEFGVRSCILLLASGKCTSLICVLPPLWEEAGGVSEEQVQHGAKIYADVVTRQRNRHQTRLFFEKPPPQPGEQTPARQVTRGGRNRKPPPGKHKKKSMGQTVELLSAPEHQTLTCVLYYGHANSATINGQPPCRSRPLCVGGDSDLRPINSFVWKTKAPAGEERTRISPRTNS